MPTDKVTVKLYPLEYAALYRHIRNLSENVITLGLTASVGSLLMYDFFCRKGDQIVRNARGRKMRSISLKPHEARALYDELRLYSSYDIVLGQIFGHLDLAMVNLGFQNQQL